MKDIKEVVCPSGAILKIKLAPFADAKALYQAILFEVKNINLNTQIEVATIYKDLFCVGFSSPEIEQALWECFKRCTYSGTGADLKIDRDTFEPPKAREDYMTVCIEVAKENILPFAKSLYAEYQRMLAITVKDPK